MMRVCDASDVDCEFPEEQEYGVRVRTARGKCCHHDDHFHHDDCDHHHDDHHCCKHKKHKHKKHKKGRKIHIKIVSIFDQ